MGSPAPSAVLVDDLSILRAFGAIAGSQSAERDPTPRRYAARPSPRAQRALEHRRARGVLESGFCPPEGPVAHPGYGPGAESATHHELVRLGFRELPRDPRGTLTLTGAFGPGFPPVGPHKSAAERADKVAPTGARQQR
jgi:hypothetical protein